MAFKLLYYLNFILCLILVTSQLEALLNSSTLVTVNLFTRHGARSPIIAAPSPLLFDPVDWGAEGHLTSVGKFRMFKLGRMLGEKYKHFLSSDYMEDEVDVMSTQCQRTENSALALMAGLYNVTTTQFWTFENPIPNLIIETDYTIDKSGIINGDSCTALKRDQELSILAAQQNDKEFEDVYRFLTGLSGRKITGMFDIFPFWDNLECLAHNGLKLPLWSERVYPERMSKIQAKILRSMIVGTERMVRLTSGPFLKELHEQFTSASLGESRVHKLRYHSGHDFSMTANLASFGVYEKVVKPGDALLVELHNVPDQGFVVQVLYMSEKGEKTQVIQIKECYQPCPLSKFIQVTQHFVPDNWSLECNTFEVIH